MLQNLGLTLSGLLALGIAAQWLGWLLKKPAIIFLLAIGILLGPTFHLFNPDALLGDLLFPVISLGVAIILFEGALTLDLQEIKNHGRVVTNLVSIGVLITIAITAIAAHFIMGFSYQMALLFGALVCVTGPTVIIPLLRSVRPNRTISNILRWEGVIIDPIGALFVVLIYEFIIAGHALLIFTSIIMLGLVLGFAAAQLLALLINRQWVPKYLHNVFTLALVLLVYSVSNTIEPESGLLTVTVMGMVLANIKRFKTEDILDFKESLSLIVISMLFILLSARINFAGFQSMGMKGIFILAVIIFIARPISVFISSMKSKLSLNEKLMLSWIAPRGIVAAAVSSLFVLKLPHDNGDGSSLLVPLVFTVIIGTVILQSLTAKPIANLLKVADPNPNGVLIAGGSDFAIALAKSIVNNGFDVRIASTSYSQTSKARMEGINSYYGNVVSEHADRQLSLVGFGHLLAMTPHPEVNMLATLRYRSEFGANHVYRIKINHDKTSNKRQRVINEWQTAWLFDQNQTFGKLEKLVVQGATIKTTTISENYPFSQYVEENPNNIPLYAVSTKDLLYFFTSRNNFEVAKGWKVITLVANSTEVSAIKNEKRIDEKRLEQES